MNKTPYGIREYCTCNINPTGHYHYDKKLWKEWFMLKGRKTSFLSYRRRHQNV